MMKYIRAGVLEKDQKVWRYMDFTKYVDLLITNSLFFCRIDMLADIFEGSLTTYSARERNKIIKDTKYKKYLPIEDLKPSKIKEAQKRFAVNCWHINDNESAAMWKLYLQAGEGIAIQSTYDRLKNCFYNKKQSILIKPVDYYDYEKERLDNFQLLYHRERFFTKRMSFEHEHELRCLIENVNLEQGGIKIKVDMEKLIENVYISPSSPIWITQLVKETTKKIGIKANVINSRINGNPIF